MESQKEASRTMNKTPKQMVKEVADLVDRLEKLPSTNYDLGEYETLRKELNKKVTILENVIKDTFGSSIWAIEYILHSASEYV